MPHIGCATLNGSLLKTKRDLFEPHLFQIFSEFSILCNAGSKQQRSCCDPLLVKVQDPGNRSDQRIFINFIRNCHDLKNLRQVPYRYWSRLLLDHENGGYRLYLHLAISDMTILHEKDLPSSMKLATRRIDFCPEIAKSTTIE